MKIDQKEAKVIYELYAGDFDCTYELIEGQEGGGPVWSAFHKALMTLIPLGNPEPQYLTEDEAGIVLQHIIDMSSTNVLLPNEINFALRIIREFKNLTPCIAWASSPEEAIANAQKGSRSDEHGKTL